MRVLRNNCSLCEECDSLSRFQNKSLSEGILIKLYEFIFISSIVIALHMIDILILSEFKLKKIKLAIVNLKSIRLLQMISLSILIITLPFITLFITLALLYKVLCSFAIKRKDKRFVKFLDSFDVFCCLEDKTTTDIQGVIQSNTIEIAVANIKEKLHNVFKNYSTDKIFYRRNEKYGFYYWRRYSFINLAQYVQIVDVPEILTKVEHNLENVEIANQVVPYKDEGLFKILIMKNDFGDNDRKDEYKMTLKFHHSIKDVALIEFIARLVETADDCQVTLVPTLKSEDYDSPDALMNMITKLCGILARSFEDNEKAESHKERYTFNRMKTLEWTKSDENLLCKVKDVKDNVCDFSLSDILRDSLNTVLRKLER